MPDDQITASRFSILVPSPKVRLNMGKPEEGASPFGYTGMSLQSDRHLFIDVNKVTLYQSGTSAMWQVGAQWLQYANGNMYMSCLANNTMAAENKVTIAAGAGYGQVTSLDHAQAHVTPRLESYNNLKLHYRVEEVHNGLKALFYGDQWQTHQEDTQDTQSTRNTGAAPNPQYPAGGLLKKLWDGLEDLGYGSVERTHLLEPLEWEGDYKEMRNGWPGAGKASAYPQIRPFDPYPSTPYKPTLPATEIYANFVQTVNFFHRFVDVLRRIGDKITDFKLFKIVQNFIAIWGHAQEGFEALLNVTDIARWDRTGDGSTQFASIDEFGNVKGRSDNVQNFGSTKATLTSLAEPYDVTMWPAADRYFEIRDVKNGTLTRVNLDALPAALTLVPSVDYKVLDVHRTTSGAAASVNVDGTVVHYSAKDPAQPTVFTWDALPSGYAWADVAETKIQRTDSAFFAASAGDNVSISESITDTLAISIDGTPYTVSLSGLGSAATAAARASALATAVNAQKAGAATASGSVVTITGTALGPSGSVQIASSNSSAATHRAGTTATSATGVGAALTADAIAARLSGNFSASASGGVITVEHNVGGSTSYLEVEGPCATQIWGGDPVEAKGKDADWLKNFEDARVLQFEWAKWPEDVRNLFRPVYQAFGDLMAVYDRIKGIVDEVLDIAGAGLSPPSAIGMFAESGITLGAGGPLFGVGDSVTLIASPKGAPDDRKFAMGIIEKFLTGEQHWWNKWWENDWFKIPKKPTHRGEPGYGGFRVVSSQDVVLFGARDTRVFGARAASLDGESASVTSKNETKVAAKDGGLTLDGKTITVGRLADEGAARGQQKKTDELHVRSHDDLEIETTALRAVFKGNKAEIGKRDDQNPLHVLKADPRLYIDVASKVQIGVGDNAGAVAQGVTVESGGEVKVTSNSKVTITGSGASLEMGAAAKFTGKLQVGNTLVVNDTGTVAPGVITPEVLAPVVRKVQLPAEYAATMAQARALRALVDTTLAAAGAITTVLGKFNLPPMQLGEAKAKEALLAALQTQYDQLDALAIKRAQLLVEARNLGLEPAALGVQPTDRAVFNV